MPKRNHRDDLRSGPEGESAAPARPEPWRRRLFLPAYRVSDAARYAGISPQTVAYWHYSSSEVGPALPGKERRVPLSYLQLIEVAFVATFRRLGVPLQRIRKAREYAQQTLQSEFPFAELRWRTEGYHLLLRLQEIEPANELNALIIADSAGQTAWAPLVGDRFAEFDYDDGGIAITWHCAGRQNPIKIDPRISFGAPIIRGIPTWVIKGRTIAGETIEEIQHEFDLDSEDVLVALKFEGIQAA